MKVTIGSFVGQQMQSPSLLREGLSCDNFDDVGMPSLVVLLGPRSFWRDEDVALPTHGLRAAAMQRAGQLFTDLESSGRGIPNPRNAMGSPTMSEVLNCALSPGAPKGGVPMW